MRLATLVSQTPPCPTHRERAAMVSTHERFLIRAAGALLLFCFLVSLALFAYAIPDPALRSDFLKALFDKLLLGGIVAAVGLVAGIWLEDAKVRRTFYLNQQIAAARAVMQHASDLSSAAGDWFFYHCRPQDKSKFEKQFTDFGSAFSENLFLLPKDFRTALQEFHRLLLEVYYPCRDETPYDWASLPDSPDAMSCAEFVLALRDSLAAEFQMAVGFPASSNDIDLRSDNKKPFPTCVKEWEIKAIVAARK